LPPRRERKGEAGGKETRIVFRKSPTLAGLSEEEGGRGCTRPALDVRGKRAPQSPFREEEARVISTSSPRLKEGGRCIPHYLFSSKRGGFSDSLLLSSSEGGGGGKERKAF